MNRKRTELTLSCHRKIHELPLIAFTRPNVCLHLPVGPLIRLSGKSGVDKNDPHEEQSVLFNESWKARFRYIIGGHPVAF